MRFPSNTVCLLKVNPCSLNLVSCAPHPRISCIFSLVLASMCLYCKQDGRSESYGSLSGAESLCCRRGESMLQAAACPQEATSNHNSWHVLLPNFVSYQPSQKQSTMTWLPWCRGCYGDQEAGCEQQCPSQPAAAAEHLRFVQVLRLQHVPLLHYLSTHRYPDSTLNALSQLDMSNRREKSNTSVGKVK